MAILLVGVILACPLAAAQEPNPESAPSGIAPSNSTSPADTVPADTSIPATVDLPAGTVTSKLFRYAKRIVTKYDTNADGRLVPEEWAALHGDPANADLDHNGEITVDEFARFVANHGAGRRIRLSTTRDTVVETVPPANQPETNPPGASTPEVGSSEQMLDRRRDLKFFAQLPDGVPSWFIERDTDGDAQLTLVEFSPKLRNSDVAEFKRYDVNGDGVLTAAELTRKPAGDAPFPSRGTSQP